jgi:hypothetical protein
VGSLARFTRIPVGPLSPIMTERSINYHFGTFDVPAKMRAVGRNRSTPLTMCSWLPSVMGSASITNGWAVR